VIGDFGDGGSAQGEVADSMRETTIERDIALLVTTGDNFYSNDIERIWDEPYSWLEDRSIEVAAAWGNHDVVSEMRRQLVQASLGPPGRWYSAPLGPEGRLIVLDSNHVDDSRQSDWFESELEEAGAPTVVIFHHPPYSCGSHGNEDAIHEEWLPLIESDDVELVLSGHEHNYQRFEVGTTTYVVTGGGGRGLTDLGECSSDTPRPMASDDERHHFLLMDVDGKSIAIEAIAADGSTIDRFEIDYRAGDS
jgi:3',5'-cyclic AMP phosphodiesterase CpdA